MNAQQSRRRMKRDLDPKHLLRRRWQKRVPDAVKDVGMTPEETLAWDNRRPPFELTKRPEGVELRLRLLIPNTVLKKYITIGTFIGFGLGAWKFLTK
jgi:hypothetical protein